VNLFVIYDLMLEFGELNKDKKFAPTKLTSVIRGFIGTDDLIVKTRRDSNVDEDQIIVSGFYDPSEDEENSPSIVVHVNYNPNQILIAMKDIDWPNLCIDILECAGHEIIHQSQYRARGFDVGPICFISGNADMEQRLEQEYLGNADEVEAYGYSIAVDAYLRYRSERLTAAQVKKSPIYKTYLSTFGIQHPVMKQLLEYSCKYHIQLTGGSHVKK